LTVGILHRVRLSSFIILSSPFVTFDPFARHVQE
jgi:hypothetical protein